MYKLQRVCDCRAGGSAVEHGVSSRLHLRRLRRQCRHVHLLRAVGVSDGRHSPPDGRTFGISAHAQTPLVCHQLLYILSRIYYAHWLQPMM